MPDQVRHDGKSAFINRHSLNAPTPRSNSPFVLRQAQDGGFGRSLIRHIRLHFIFSIGFLYVIHDLGDNRFARQTKAVEFSETVNADENRHVMSLEAGEADRGEDVEQIGREDVKRIGHVQPPKREYPAADS